MKNFKIEICANSVQSCVEAQKGGAYRVELCAGIPEGGTTPSYGEIAIAREMLDIKLHVIIRPRGGDFLYSDIEHETMLKDIEMCRKLRVDGVVFGSLTPDGDVDIRRNEALIKAAQGMSLTFHRAFDMCRNPMESLEKIIALGYHRILTSGQQARAEEGTRLIARLIEKAADRIIIMPGCGINAHNIVDIANQTGAREFHLSARSPADSAMRYRNSAVSMGTTHCVIPEYQQLITDADKVRNTIKELHHINK